MANQERDPRAYELMTVFVPDISEEDTQAQVEKVSTYIANAGGTVTETLIDSPWGRRRLAYTIRYNGTDYRDGYYTVFHFDSAPSNLTELERDLKLDTSVMRYLLVHDDPKAGEKPREGEDEATEGEAPAEATATPQTAAPAEQATEAAPTEQAAEAPPAEQATETAPASEATETQTEPTDTAPAEAESAPEAAAAEETTEDAATPAADASTDADEAAAAEPAAVAAESDTDETTDKE